MRLLSSTLATRCRYTPTLTACPRTPPSSGGSAGACRATPPSAGRTPSRCMNTLRPLCHRQRGAKTSSSDCSSPGPSTACFKTPGCNSAWVFTMASPANGATWGWLRCSSAPPRVRLPPQPSLMPCTWAICSACSTLCRCLPPCSAANGACCWWANFPPALPPHCSPTAAPGA